MDSKSKFKLTLTERYKSNDRKFTSLEESRHLRAIKKKEEQKLSREKSLANFRVTSSCNTPSLKPKEEATPSTTTKKFTKKELRELGKIRYNDMLKWKEERKKLLDKEKNCRKPSFKLGGFTPDAPKFLAGKLSENPERTTPNKFSQTLRGTSTKKMTPSIPKSSFGTKKSLVFHTGVTPLPAMSSSVAKPFRNRSQRAFRPPPELGVSPFPETPGALPRRRPLMRRADSFAPSNFQFKAPTGVEHFPQKQSSSVLRSVSNLPSKQEEKKYTQLEEIKRMLEINRSVIDNKKSQMDLETKENDSCAPDEDGDFADHKVDISADKDHSTDDNTEINPNADDKTDVDDNADNSETLYEDCSNKIEKASSETALSVKEVDVKLSWSKVKDFGNDDHDDAILPDLMASDNMDTSANNLIEDEDQNYVMECEEVNETENLIKNDIVGSDCDGNIATNKISNIKDDNYNEMKNEDKVDDNISIFKVDEILSPIESGKFAVKDDDRIISKRRTRSKIYTPPLSKLRPRTPCSRSTRRSMLAHCNSDHCDHPTKTPKSNKKRSRKSVVKPEKEELRIDFEDQEGNEDDIDIALKQEEKEELKTDSVDETEKKANRISYLENIDRAQDRKSLKNKTPESSDTRTPGSLDNLSVKRLGQLAASPWITRSRGSSSSNSKKKRRSVFDIIIKEGDCALPSEEFGSPAGSQGASPSFKENQNKLFELLKHTDKASESPEVSVWSPDTSQASPRLSQNMQAEIAKIESKPTPQLTPALKSGNRGRRSSKKVSLLLPMDEEHTSTTKYPVTPISKASRASKSGCISLLPGLETHKENTETATVLIGENADLTSWDSPAASKRGRKSRTSIMTPRISLLPGLNSHLEEDEEAAGIAPLVDENVDLISWDSPVMRQTPSFVKRKSRKSINLNTPIRRSTRHNPI